MNEDVSDVAAASTSPDARADLNRTITPVSGRADGARGKAIALAGLVLGCAVFAAVTWRQEHPRAPRPPPKRPVQQIVPFEAVRAEATADSPRPLADPSTATPTEPASPGRQRPSGSSIPAPGPDTPPAPSSMLAYSQPSSRIDPVIRPASTATPTPETELDQLRRGSDIASVKASRLAQRDLMLVAGTLIPCVLETALDSSTPGYVSCLITRDVYSATGAVVVLEKGSRVLGEYRAGMRQGQRRLFVLWTRALTPSGVAVQLSSPASDPLGRAGFDGDLDTHFWDRFGGAVVLSILDLGVAELGNNEYGYLVREPSAAAAVAVEKSIDIPPSLRKRHGEEVAIFTAVDLDFGPVYRLKAR